MDKDDDHRASKQCDQAQDRALDDHHGDQRHQGQQIASQACCDQVQYGSRSVGPVVEPGNELAGLDFVKEINPGPQYFLEHSLL